MVKAVKQSYILCRLKEDLYTKELVVQISPTVLKFPTSVLKVGVEYSRNVFFKFNKFSLVYTEVIPVLVKFIQWSSFLNFKQCEEVYASIASTYYFFTVLVSKLTDICSDVMYDDLDGHIASPSFPAMYPPNKNCTCLLSASNNEHVQVMYHHTLYQPRST